MEELLLVLLLALQSLPLALWACIALRGVATSEAWLYLRVANPVYVRLRISRK